MICLRSDSQEQVSVHAVIIVVIVIASSRVFFRTRGLVAAGGEARRCTDPLNALLIIAEKLLH